MPAGRPPKPKAILHLSNPDKARRRPEIGITPSHLPLVPAHLSPSAADKFLNTCETLHRMGVLAESDTEIVARYSIALDMFHAASEQLKEEVEPVREVVDPKTGEMRFTRNCAALDLWNQMSSELRRLESALGLSPVDRAKLGIVRSEEQKRGGDPFGDLMAS